jgi:hypothetical protein
LGFWIRLAGLVNNIGKVVIECVYSVKRDQINKRVYIGHRQEFPATLKAASDKKKYLFTTVKCFSLQKDLVILLQNVFIGLVPGANQIKPLGVTLHIPFLYARPLYIKRIKYVQK